MKLGSGATLQKWWMTGLRVSNIERGSMPLNQAIVIFSYVAPHCWLVNLQRAHVDLQSPCLPDHFCNVQLWQIVDCLRDIRRGVSDKSLLCFRSFWARKTLQIWSKPDQMPRQYLVFWSMSVLLIHKPRRWMLLKRNVGLIISLKNHENTRMA